MSAYLNALAVAGWTYSTKAMCVPAAEVVRELADGAERLRAGS
jgi:hypothetical protein